MRVHPVFAVARDDDVARYVDIVDEARLRKGNVLAGQVIDVQPRLLVGRDDQRMVRIGGIDPDRRIVGGIGTVRADGLRLAARTHRNRRQATDRSEEHTSELQSLMRISYAVFCLKNKKKTNTKNTH